MKPIKPGSKVRRNLSKRWYNMISRCTDPKHPRYPQYGGANVTISSEWEDKERFLLDVKKLPGYDEDKLLAGDIHLDKDTIDPDANVYSKDTCMFIDIVENNKIKPNQMLTFIATHSTGVELEATNQSEFAIAHGLNQSSISACLKNKIPTHYGWNFKYKE